MKKPNYLKTWMGVTSGSHLGRDDGHPEQKFATFVSLTALNEHGEKKGERIYVLSDPPADFDEQRGLAKKKKKKKDLAAAIQTQQAKVEREQQKLQELQNAG
tara:strand:- start:918 stop:1223 length:306 start_codon:yes stop_codon:yes gene_type:complete